MFIEVVNHKRPIIVAVSGLSSNTGKTTLVCELLERLPGWEAIKLTRGHYRSCGKDPKRLLRQRTAARRAVDSFGPRSELRKRKRTGQVLGCRRRKRALGNSRRRPGRSKD